MSTETSTDEYRQEYLELYKQYRDELRHLVTAHIQHARYVVTILVFTLAGTLTGVYYFEDPPILRSLVMIVGGAVGISIAISGLLICDIFYRRRLEAIVASAKMEALLGLTNAQPEQISRIFFPDDTTLLPDRWVLNLQGASSSAAFVQKQMKSGVNRVVHLTLWFFVVLNCLLVFIGIVHARFLYTLLDNPWLTN